MRFGLIVGTRGRPRQAAAVIECARMLASGEHEVEYVVACDDNDPADTAGFFKHYDGVRVDCRAQPAGLAEIWNRNIAEMDCDLYMNMTDDGFVSPLWDQVAAQTVDEVYRPPLSPALAVLAWSDTANPGQPTMFLMHREWFRVAGPFEQRFPFWFADTALGEVWSFVTGTPMRCVPGLVYSCLPARFNPRLRDMDFWWDYYAFLRAERVGKAREIRAALGLPPVPQVLVDRLVADHQARDVKGRQWSREIVARLPPREPSDAYRRAKAAAEADMLPRLAA